METSPRGRARWGHQTVTCTCTCFVSPRDDNLRGGKGQLVASLVPCCSSNATALLSRSLLLLWRLFNELPNMWRHAAPIARTRGIAAAVAAVANGSSSSSIRLSLRSTARRTVPSLSSDTSFTSTLFVSQRLSSSTMESTEGSPHVEFPIVQFPARSLLSRQAPLDLQQLKDGDYSDMIDTLVRSRKHYQYPSLSAPQVGWNVRVFTLFDGSVWVNPVIVETNCDMPAEGAEVEPGVFSASLDEDGGKVGCGLDCTPYRAPRKQPVGSCWAWEPCASCAFLMHYVERAGTCRIRGYNEKGEVVERYADGMLARFMLHEMDHLDGVLFTRKIPDTNHVVLLDGFSTMSDWSDDYPSLEARSTFLYTTFTPPYTFVTDNVADAALLDRKFEDGIYPGHEMDRQLRAENMVYDDMQRAQWKDLKGKMAEDAEMSGEGVDEDEEKEPMKSPN